MSDKKTTKRVTFQADLDAVDLGHPDVATVAATPGETRAMITRHSARGYSVYRHILVQLPDSHKDRSSTLGKMVSGKQRRELLLYMLLLTAWPWLEERERPFPSDVWMRALSADPADTDPLTRKNALTWSPSTLSRAWKSLEDLTLIEPRGKREDRWVRIIPRREDRAKEYSVPGGRKDRYNTYFTLPDRFWLEDDFARLTLPGLAMLLIIAKETSYQAEVWLRQESAAAWYGISRTTVQAGLKELEGLGLLHKRTEVVKSPLARHGITQKNFYSLTGDYGYEARTAARERAKKAGDARRKKPATDDDA